jgi:hypothetical protein
MRPALETEGSLRGRFALAAPAAAADVVLANNHRKLFRSADGAKTWTVVGGIPQTTRIQQIVSDAGDVLFAATEEGIYRSSDAGATWTVAGKGAQGFDVQTILVDPESPGTIYGGTWQKGILWTTDAGKTWARIGGDPPHPDAAALALEKGPHRALLVGFGGGSVWRLDLDAIKKTPPPASKKK